MIVLKVYAVAVIVELVLLLCLPSRSSQR